MTDAIRHSAIGASSRHRWSKCPGSVRLCDGVPTVTNKYAELGTHAHDVAAKLLEDPAKHLALFQISEDEELLSAVFEYANIVEKETENATLRRIEYPFDMSSLYPGLYGTCDAYAYHRDERLLRIYDYKHGSGHFVPVKENVQLIYYALGALIELPFPVDRVELNIIQPRCPKRGEIHHKWEFPVTEVYGFIDDLITEAKATSAADAPLNPGEWCFFCPAQSFCPAKSALRAQKAKELFSSTPVEEETTITTKKENYADNDA